MALVVLTDLQPIAATTATSASSTSLETNLALMWRFFLLQKQQSGSPERLQGELYFNGSVSGNPFLVGRRSSKSRMAWAELFCPGRQIFHGAAEVGHLRGSILGDGTCRMPSFKEKPRRVSRRIFPAKRATESPKNG
jgi:hypothetical protein